MDELMMNWRRVLVVAMAVSLAGVACTSNPDVIAGTETEDETIGDGPDVEQGIDVDWLTGTAWTVIATSDFPVDTDVTLSFSTSSGALILDVFDECGASGALMAVADTTFTVEPLGGDDCLGATNLREQLVGSEGELIIEPEDDALLITTEAGLLVIAEHFQSISIQSTSAPQTTIGPSNDQSVPAPGSWTTPAEASSTAEVKVLVANGTDSKGVATSISTSLVARGYTSAPANAQMTDESVIYYREPFEDEAAAVAEIIGATTDLVAPAADVMPVASDELSNGRLDAAHVIVIIGLDGRVPTG